MFCAAPMKRNRRIKCDPDSACELKPGERRGEAMAPGHEHGQRRRRLAWRPSGYRKPSPAWLPNCSVTSARGIVAPFAAYFVTRGCGAFGLRLENLDGLDTKNHRNHFTSLRTGRSSYSRSIFGLFKVPSDYFRGTGNTMRASTYDEDANLLRILTPQQRACVLVFGVGVFAAYPGFRVVTEPVWKIQMGDRPAPQAFVVERQRGDQIQTDYALPSVTKRLVAGQGFCGIS